MRHRISSPAVALFLLIAATSSAQCPPLGSPSLGVQFEDDAILGFSDPEISLEVWDAGEFQNYYYKQYPAYNNVDLGVHMLFFVYRPKCIPANGAGLVGVLSHEFVSGDFVPSVHSNALGSLYLRNFANPASVAASPAFLSAARPYIRRGYTVFTLTHGSIASTTPGWVLPEMFEQLHREVRVIRAYAQYFQIQPNRLAVSGGSSGGGCAQSLWLENYPADPTQPYYDPAIDCQPSRIDVAVVASTGCDAANWRGTGLPGDPIDNSYPWRKPHFWLHPDFSGDVDHILSLVAPTQVNYPVPSLPKALSAIDPAGKCLDAYDYQNAFSFYTNNHGAARYAIFPENSFNTTTNSLDPAWYLPAYQYGTTAEPYFRPEFLAYIQRFSSYNAIQQSLQNPTANYGPIFWVNGEDDQIVVFQQAKRFSDVVGQFNAAHPGAPIPLELFGYSGEGHAWRSLDGEHMSAGLRFVDHYLATTVIVDNDRDGLPVNGDPDDHLRDTDGDGQSDSAEVTASTSPIDPSAVFRITDVTAQLASSTIQITFFAPRVGAYRVQTAPNLGDPDAGELVPVWTDLTTLTVATTGTTTTSPISIGNLIPSPANGGAPSAQTRRFYRVRLDPCAPGGVVATAPVAVLHGIIARPPSGGAALVNYLSAPVCRPDIVQARLTGHGAGAWQLQTQSGVASPLAGVTLAANHAIAIVIEDGLIASAAPAMNPENRGAEGRWWMISSNTADSVVLTPRVGLASAIDFPSVPVGSIVAIRALNSLKDVLGPGADPANLGVAGFYPKSGDAVWLYAPGLNSVGTRARYKFGTTATNMALHWFETATTATNGVYAVVDDAPDLAQVLIMPDEAVGYTAAPSSNGDDSYRLLVGFVPMSDVVAYISTASGSGLPVSSHQRTVVGWPFPQDAHVFTRYGTTANFIDSGFVRDPVGGHPKSDRLAISDPLSATFTGDSLSNATRYAAEVDFAMAQDPARYWDVRYLDAWYALTAPNVETRLTDSDRDSLRLTWSHGVTVEAGVNHSGTVEWHLRRSYMRPLEW